VLERPASSWDEIELTPTVPAEPPVAKVWMDFVRLHVPVQEWQVRDTLPEQAFQKLALERHGTLDGVNRAYGRQLASIRQLGIPFGEAALVTFDNRQWAFMVDQVAGSYGTVFDYLFRRGRAVSNTIILVLLAITVALTVNPLAGYALSRFRLRSTERIIVFCLATMAFPAAVAAIPGFLLLRDLGFLNTFAALILPGAANGMTIFLLKGFFDSLPRELYEAATIDGAPEWQIFWNISIPLVKPILAVSMLNAFIHAYNGWEWAIIVCQDRQMWTIAVWTYQFYQTLTGAPYAVMAAFIVNSIPMLIIFLLCQKIILRGIILPQMK
jgi:multiple sugar transport system permease protein